MFRGAIMIRLKELRIAMKKLQKDVAKDLSLSPQVYCNYETGQRQPTPEMLQKLADYFNVSVDYILGRTDNSSSVQEFDYEKYGLRPVIKKRFPILGSVACGKPIFAEEEHETYIDASSDIKADFVVVAKGDSMIDVRIHDGDLVFVRKEKMVNNGDIAVVWINEEVTLKRWFYYPDKQKLALYPANPNYEPLVYIGEELDGVLCLGKAVAFMSNL